VKAWARSTWPPDARPQALTTARVALVLGVHPHTVKRIPPDELPYFRVGLRGDRRYRVADVDAYVTRRSAQ
jgi:hypothetical protein